MLNELSELSRSLSSHNVDAHRWHPWIKSFKKGDALIARIDDQGKVESVFSISAEQLANLRNISPDFQKSFPGFNLKCPLLRGSMSPDSVTPIVDARNSVIAYRTSDLHRLTRLLVEFPRQILTRFQGASDERLQATKALLHRITADPIEPETFLRQLAEAVVDGVKHGRIDEQYAASILYGKLNRRTRLLDSWQLTLILEVSETERFSYGVADAAVAAELSAALFASDTIDEQSSSDSSFRCALTGALDSPQKNKFPNPTLPMLGGTYLMSKNEDAPCQARYGQFGPKSFPIGKSTVQGLLDAVQFITRPELRGRTWSGVPSASGDRSDLVVSYLEDEPDANIPLAEFFADSDPDLESATYAQRTKVIHAALAARVVSQQDRYVCVFALSQIDPGRKQILFSSRFSVQAIFDGSERWLAGANNVPPITVPFFQDKELKWELGAVPSPGQLMMSFKRQWLRYGATSQTVPGVSLGRIYDLLLEPDANREAVWLLDTYIPRNTPLLIGLGRLLLRSISAKDFPQTARREALVVIAAYGILLLRQGRMKETYMNQRDYLLGQFLQFADRLHKLYCEHERKGSIPPQLVGNATISMATQSPSRALQVLAQRLPIYLAWADRYTGQNAGLVKWTRKELGRLSALLKDADLTCPVMGNGRAELLLGYLANAPTKQEEGSKIQ